MDIAIDASATAPVPSPTAPPAAPAPPAGRTAGPHTTAPLHLLHRPVTPEGFLLDATAPVEQHFALSAELPDRHPLFNDGPGTFHDLLFAAETLRQATHFVAHQYFRVPAERPAVFVSSGVDIRELAPWRRTGRPAHMSLDITLTPVDVVQGIPRGLDCRGGVAIDGVTCGSGTARLLFLMPRVYRAHRERGRRESLHGTAPAPRPLGRVPVGPEPVGRGDARNVLVGPPLRAVDGEFVLPVAPAPGHEVFDAGPEGHIPGPVFLEASRQAALVVAAELHGFRPAHAVLTHWWASFRGFGEAGLPLTCTVNSRSPLRDGADRPMVRTRLTFSQGSRVLCTASATLLQDC
ncbi:AfsA-related hotdog domain-containing protein [Streptomyces sp. NPDC001985]|uniref:AfsA-related hotdog domain-containing protein n=1 Tax=Streptomyces sp. NPDC001985 TaxID=3154406 RepID=UPI003331015F